MSAASLAQPASAASCDLAHARYIEPQSGLVLQFTPLDDKLMRASATANMFFLTTADGDVTFHGDVIWNMGLSRPNGSVLIPGCEQAEDDTSPEASCTIWEGVVYALSGKGIITLPEYAAKAPEQVLLTDFGRALRYGLWDFEAYSGDIFADDVFSYDGCAP